jgi:hypothetical protein
MMIARSKPTLLPSKTMGGRRPIFLFAGQSNVNGFKNIADLPVQFQQEFNNVKFFIHSADNHLQFKNINWQDNTTYQAGTQAAKYSTQFEAFTRIQTQLGTDAYFIQYSAGNNILAVDWLSTTVGANFDTLLYRAVQMKNCVTDQDNETPDFRFFYWGQGEADAGTLAYANAYETNLTNFINNFRTRLGYSVPFLIARLNTNVSLVSCPYAATVRAAQTAVAGALSNVFLVNMDDCEMETDSVHYTNTGYGQIGANIISVAQTNGLL